MIDVKKSVLIIVLSLFFFSCASSRSVVRTSADTQTDISGKWNDTDSRLVAEEMIKDLSQRGWLNDFSAEEDRKPVLIVGTIKNKTSEHIAVDTFIKDLERELINAGKVKFVASVSAKRELRQEVEDQQSQATEESAKALASETGADFMLQGVLSSVTDAVEGKKAVFYQVDLELVNIETSEKVWVGTKKIKKIISKDKYRW